MKVFFGTLLLLYSLSAGAVVATYCPAPNKVKEYVAQFPPKQKAKLVALLVSCGYDPTKYLTAADFGGVLFPSAAPMLQSEGGDSVSPS